MYTLVCLSEGIRKIYDNNLRYQEEIFMHNTDIVRKIDELGRIVLPNEVRKALGWDVGDSLAVSYDTQDNQLILTFHEKRQGMNCAFCE